MAIECLCQSWINTAAIKKVADAHDTGQPFRLSPGKLYKQTGGELGRARCDACIKHFNAIARGDDERFPEFKLNAQTIKDRSPG
jgi:hypothetical protein